MRMKRVQVMGSDLSGRRCPVASVAVPADFDRAQSGRFIRGIVREAGIGGYDYKPYAVVNDADLIGDFSEPVARCPHCNKELS